MNLDDFHDADGRPVQPRYAAYMIAHGYDRVPTGSQHEFLIWSSSMWRQSGIPEPRFETERAAMAEWLPARLAGPLLPVSC